MGEPNTLPLLIGVGNEFAGDDAAGRLVAQRLDGAEGFDVRETHGAAADLVTMMEGRARVLIVDACHSGAPAGTVIRLDAGAGDLPPYLNSVSSHGIGVAEGVKLAQVLGSLPPRVEIWAIEGVSTCVGDPVSPEVLESVEAVVRDIPAALA